MISFQNIFLIKIFTLIFVSTFIYNITIKNEDIIYKIKHYINICKNGFLLYGIRHSSLIKKISTIIATFNREDTIKSAVRSTQNQKMKDIEIIIVDDNSRDNSLKIIEELQKYDSRIIIIKNKRNRGALYSKSIGVLMSKGKYLILLDSDDLFANDKLFIICFKELKTYNIDILEFSGINYNSSLKDNLKIDNIPPYLRFKKHNQIVKQPYLSKFIYQKKNNKIIRLIDGYLWGKCIKNQIYKKSLNVLGRSVFTQKVNYGDDRIVNFILFRIAFSFKFIKKIGIIYNINHKLSITRSRNRIGYCHDELLNLMSLYNLTHNSSEIEIVLFEIKKRWRQTIFYGLSKENKKTLKTLFLKIINNKFVQDIDKKKLKALVKI